MIQIGIILIGVAVGAYCLLPFIQRKIDNYKSEICFYKGRARDIESRAEGLIRVCEAILSKESVKSSDKVRDMLEFLKRWKVGSIDN